MSLTTYAIVLGAGICAGAINTVAGGGTLLAYPALLACGLSPTAANMTSLIGLTWGYIGGAIAYSGELRVQRNRLKALWLPAVLGGLIGATLLLTTPNGLFKHLVPFLVLASVTLLLAQPLAAKVLQRGQAETADSRNIKLAQICVLAAGVYGAYFSAGLGVLLLGLLGIALSDGLQHLNALKAALSLAIVAAGVAVYLGSSQINWVLVAILLPSSAVGGLVGGRLARALSPTVLRWGICTLGAGLACVLLIRG